MFKTANKAFLAVLSLFFRQVRVARRCEPIREKSTAYKPLPITPRNTDATRRFIFRSHFAISKHPQHNRAELRSIMEHRGVEYRIIQGIKRGFWKWSIDTETGTKSGTSDSRDAAMNAAKRAIDNALDPKKRKLVPPA